MLLARGTLAFSGISLRLYQCNFDKNTLSQAKKDAGIEGKFENLESLTAQQTVEAIKVYLHKTYGIIDWEIKVSELTDFYIRLETQQKCILVSKSINWDFCDLDNVLAHEIDTHLVRAINASLQQNLLFQKSLPFYLKTEEGLASYLGDYFSTSARLSRKHHALKYLAGYLALTNSFYKVYQFFIENGFTPPLAFRRTFRLKRGFIDTSMFGCYGREVMYYEGMLEVKNYLENDGDIKKLYAGKIGLKNVNIIPIPKNEIIPIRIKRFIKNKIKYKTVGKSHEVSNY